MNKYYIADGNNAEVMQAELTTPKEQQANSASTCYRSDGIHLVTRARSECLDLSNLIYKKLPKQLRDIVYSYLCLEDRQIPIGPYYHFRKYEPLRMDNAEYSDKQYFPRHGDLQTVLPDGRIRTDHDIYPQVDFVMPDNHIFNPNYMRKEIVLEMLQMYYSSNSFSVCNIECGLENLCTAVMLDSEEPAVDFVPIDHIRNLQIRIKGEHFNNKVNSFESHPVVRLREHAEKEPFLQRTVDSLQLFRSSIQTATLHELNVEIVLMSDFKRNAENLNDVVNVHIVNLLQAVRNMVYELMHDRERTTVRVTHQDDSLMVFPKDYTGLFKLTKEQWDYEKSRQQPNHDWAQDFWILPISQSDFSRTDLLKLGGYLFDDRKSLLSSRWGIANILHKTISTIPVVDGPYWPVGRTYNPEHAKELIDKVVEQVSTEVDREPVHDSEALQPKGPPAPISWKRLLGQDPS